MEAGLYEQVVTEGIAEELAEVSAECKALEPIDGAEAAGVLTHYVSTLMQQSLASAGGNIVRQINLANKVVRLLREEVAESDGRALSVAQGAELLRALLARSDPRLLTFRSAERLPRPQTSLAQSSLFTGAIHEPALGSELKQEIASCDRIDLLVSFIKWSGLRLIIEDLRFFTAQGGRLRVITTSYMGATDLKAVEELRQLPNTTIKISYDTKRTRLHAKSYIFYRKTGFSTAYVGSSNLSNAAISSGLEWNVKVTAQDLPETMQKIAATFETYWESREFSLYRAEDAPRLAQALKTEQYGGSLMQLNYTLEVRPYSYQQEILDKLQAEREVRGYCHNLVVAATGTGKTVIAALDYRRFCAERKGKRCNLLFVAHREEILRQSLMTFRAVLQDANFGDLLVGGSGFTQSEHLFVSIQSFNSRNLTAYTASAYYDYIVVDEFHHAAASSYQKLLSYYSPQILLGLTATPERMDGKDILTYFNDRIAAEIRLPEAIERKLLCPFQYFGITDCVDLDKLKWSRGGYDKQELSNIYTLSGAMAERRAALIVQALIKYVTEVETVKGLGFCVSVEHARFMADYFNRTGIAAMSLTGTDSSEVRHSAQEKLRSGEVHLIFVVDIYNEGVDIPEVNTVLFLRPTESLTIFLQQLGRGLRLALDKDCLTVLDFIGQAHKKYNYEEKYRALLTDTKRSMVRQVREGFTAVPKGCYIQLEKVATQYILANIATSFGRSAGIIEKIASFTEDTGQALTLANFLNYYHLESRALYRYASFSRLSVKAGVREDFTEADEEIITKALPRLAVIDDRTWLYFLLRFIPTLRSFSWEELSQREKLMVRMLAVTIYGTTYEKWDEEELVENLHQLGSNTVLLGEMVELLTYKIDKIAFVDSPLDTSEAWPLAMHATYSRDQILTALGYAKPSTVREGVKWLEAAQLDVLFVTLNKADKDYSPSTMYNDYSVNEELFHWQSQSTTAESSPTGMRYQKHKERGSRVLLCVREYKNDAQYGGACAYTLLGFADYVRHTGSKPMNILWHLAVPIPAQFLPKTNKLAMG